MRTLTINLLATALLLFGATAASAASFDISATSSTDLSGTLVPSDTITIDVYITLDPGLTLFEAAVVFDDDGLLEYVGSAGVPTYILYTGGKGATYLVPNQNPYQEFGGITNPGERQIQIQWIEQALGSNAAGGTNIYIGSLIFHVAGLGDGQSTIDLRISGAAPGSTIVDFGGAPAMTATSSGTFVVNTIPEPTTAALIGFGLVGLAMAGRRQS